MRAEISALHNRLQATMIYVTHDQVEAMTMGDKIVVMKDGLVQQIGGPLHLYNNPVNLFVAGFIGSPPMNFIKVTIDQEANRCLAVCEEFQIIITGRNEKLVKPFAGKELVFGIRPEDLAYVTKEEKGKTFKAQIEVVEPLGAEIHLYVNLGKNKLIARIPPSYNPKAGESAILLPDMDKVIFFDPETEKALKED